MSIQNKNFQWYALIINPLKNKLATSSINLLKHPDIKSLLSFAEIHSSIKMKSKMLFIELNLTSDVKRRLLNIQYIYKFFPSSENPCVIKDIENFINYEKTLKEKDSSNITQDNESIINVDSIDNIEKEKNSKVVKIKNKTSENIEFRKGVMVSILTGPLKGANALVVDIDEDKNVLIIEINFANTVAVAEINKSDAELVK